MMSYLKPYIVLLIVLLHCAVCSTEAGAETDSLLKSVHFDIDNGLPTNNVYSCIQDHNGYIWMATDNGVVKYNGYSFKILTIKDGLPKNDVWRLYEDTRGRIWVFTFAYTFGYLKNDKYVSVITGESKFRQLRFFEVNNLFVFGDNAGLTAIDTNDAFFEIIYKNADSISYTLGENASLMAIDNKGHVHNYNFKDLTVKKLGPCPVNIDLITKNILADYRLNNDNKLMSTVITPGNTLFVFDYNNCSLEKVEFNKDEKLVFICIRNDVKGDKGYYLVTDKNIYTLSKEFKIIRKISGSDISDQPVLPSYLFVDSFKNKWLSTANSGVYMVPSVFPLPFNGMLSKELRDAKYVGNTYEGSTYWWKKLNKTLYIADSVMNIVYRKRFVEDVFSVADDNDTQANIAFRHYLYKWRFKDKKMFDELSGKPFTVWEHDAYESHKRWIAKNTGYELSLILANRNQLHQYDSNTLMAVGANGIFEVKSYEDHIRLNRNVIDVYNDFLYDRHTGYDWFYNEGAIYLFNPHNDAHIHLSTGLLQKIGISHIISIKQDSYGNVYILTGNRLIIYNEWSQHIRYMRLHLNLEYVGMEIYDNTIVLAGPFGVAYAKARESRFPEFKIIPNPSFLYYKKVFTFTINRTGKIILQTDKGVYLSGIKQLITAPVQYDERTLVFAGLTLHYGEKTSSRDRDTIILPQTESRIIFDLVNFYGSGAPSYTYRINKDKWQTTSSGEVLYNWEPGQYYRVECVASDALWNSRKYTFYIMQAPYWWQTTTWKRIFWAGGILLLIGLGIITALITRYYVRRKSEKKQVLTDMELRALYAQINPHFIFNTLGTAQFFINRKKMDEAYNHVNKFARLLRAYLKASSSRYVNLGEEISLLKDYIELQQIRFEQKFDYRIEVDNKIAKDSMQVPSLLLQPLVENAINHGLFHLPEGSKGMLEIRFEQGRNSEELVCYIEDNGVGRERSKTLKKDSTIEKDKSYGTTLTKKLIDIFKEYEKMDIYLEYVDKPAPETGTIVKLTIGNVKYVA